MEAPNSQMKFACVCASNVNRSMEGHDILKKNGFNVCSYGTSDKIRMPKNDRGSEPLEFDFGATYQEIMEHMEKENTDFYESSGILDMIRRDATVKTKPERFSATFSPETRKYFSVIFTYQERIMNKVLSDFRENGNQKMVLSHIVNIETPDSIENAKKASKYTLELAKRLSQTKDLTEELENVIDEYSKECPVLISFHIVTY